VDASLARNGQEALDLLERDGAFDGILMDCQMPVMDGYTATRHLRGKPAFQHIPIIAMTANAMAGDREKVMEAGMNDHIAKPLDVNLMFATLARWISPKGERRAPAPAAGGPTPPAGGALPDLPGIDKVAGLATTMGNAKLFTRMLVKFAEGQGGFKELFASARIDADPTAATRCAHTLKGTAGNIGAKRVQASAGELEQACKEGAPETAIQAILDRTLADLAIVITGLAGHPFGEKPPEAAPVAVEWAKVQPLLEQLVAQLAESDAAATDTLEELQALVQGSSLGGSLEKVASAMASFDFELAESALKALLEAR